MAQTKKPAQKKSSTASNSRSSNSRSKSSAKSTGSRSSASRNGKSTVGSVKDTVTSGAQDAAGTVAGAATNAKTALIAGGAAAAGLAATVVVARSRRRPTVLNVPLPRRKGPKISDLVPSKGPKISDLVPSRNGARRETQRIAGSVTKAADRADKLGQRVSSVASSVRQVSETANEAAKKT